MRRNRQLSLRFARGRGGPREGAGRPAGNRRTVAHRTRSEHRARFPLHVTMRARAGLPPLREGVLAEVARRAIAAASREAFRVLHFSIQSNHMHFIIEAHDKEALSRGMQGLNIRVARAINGMLRVRGRVWRERYHGRELRTPRSVRNALVYVLMNAKKHGHLRTGVDALSSAAWFDGFAERVTRPEGDSPVRAPRTWLAGVGWRRRGLIRFDERLRAPD